MLVVDAFYMSKEETEDYGWYSAGLVLILDDKTQIVVSKDPEGNGPGALFVDHPENDDVTLGDLRL